MLTINRKPNYVINRYDIPFKRLSHIYVILEVSRMTSIQIAV